MRPTQDLYQSNSIGYDVVKQKISINLYSPAIVKQADVIPCNALAVESISKDRPNANTVNLVYWHLSTGFLI